MEHNIVLSILICHLPERHRFLSALMSVLGPQKTDSVEILVDSAGREVTVGTKRNNLVSKAQGEYCCFIDDDDTVSADYVASILRALEKKPDCVGIEGMIRVEGADRLFKHSSEFAGWYTAIDAFYRTPNHLNPIKTEIVRKVKFKAAYFGEDQDFSTRVRKYLKTEVYIDHPIYFYNASACGFSAMER